MKLKLKYDDTTKIFVTADLHLLHKSILEIQKGTRSNFADINDMTEKMIAYWNAEVSSDDSVFILGDFCFGTKNKWREILKRLNGIKYLVKGNHDSDKQIPVEMFEKVEDYVELTVEFTLVAPASEINSELVSRGYPHFCMEDFHIPLKKYLVLSHYPMSLWNGSKYGSVMLHGHTHGNTPKDQLIPGRIDVGWDVFDRPVSLGQILGMTTQLSVIKSELTKTEIGE